MFGLKNVLLSRSRSVKSLADNRLTLNTCPRFRIDLDKESRSCHFLDDRMCNYILKMTPPSIDCRPARSFAELKSAFRLIYREYHIRGYCPKAASKMYFTAYCALPASRTFVLKLKRQMLGTISLIGDSACGLPMESTFSNLIGPLRWRNRKLGEVSLLSLNLNLFRNNALGLTPQHRFMASSWLFKTMFDYARHVSGLTDLVITVHPKHEKLYRSFAFCPLGKGVSYPLAEGQPGLPMHLDIRHLERHLPQNRMFRNFFFDQPVSMENWSQSFGWTGDALCRLMRELNYSWHRTSRGPVEFLRRRYPEIEELKLFSALN